MAKAKRLIEEDLKLIDIVIEVIDARIPVSSRNPDLNNMVKNKKKIIILNKSDLADEVQTKKWKEKLTNKDTIAISVNALNNIKNNEIINTIEKMMKTEKEKGLEKGRVGRTTRVLILGIPNVR
jgi:ribosome biogenesis GTPase A